MKHTVRRILAAALLLSSTSLSAQILTHEDSLSAGLTVKGKSTVISGYGEASYTNDLINHTGVARLDRNVLFVGHQFNERITLFTETELENAVVASDKFGEISVEQAFVKFDLNKNSYISAGLFTPRIGIINENHLPVTFNGVERPLVEQIVIPATWREIGVAYYGSSRRISGLNYSVALVNGLNAQGFSLAKGIGEGRSEGSEAPARCLAVTAALLYYTGPFRIQLSSYVGGSAGVNNPTADRLELSTGPFGTPVYLNEGDVQFRYNGLSIKALACIINIPDARAINRAYANNTPNESYGAYVEVGYNLLQPFGKRQQLIVFSRFERINMEAQLPENGISNNAYRQNHIISGITYLPVRGVAVKADFRHTVTGSFNEQLISNPDPFALPYQPTQDFLHLGIAYSF